MQTIYTTSCRLGIRTDNVIDLNAYRRARGLTVQEPAPVEVEVEPLLWSREGEKPAPRRARKAMSLSAWMLDICASAGVLAMTVAFTMQIL